MISLTFLRGESIKSNRTSYVKIYSKGYVNIVDKSVVLWANSYKKRAKIYDGDPKVWVDTKPLEISSLSESISNGNLDRNPSYINPCLSLVI